MKKYIIGIVIIIFVILEFIALSPSKKSQNTSTPKRAETSAVQYSEKGFFPPSATLNLKKKNSIIFYNSTNKPLTINFTTIPTGSKIFPEITLEAANGKNITSKKISFDKEGTYIYNSKLNPGRIGGVMVVNK